MPRKTVDKILDQAADILETKGFTTEMCYDPETGGYCALGAIARAAYPKAKNADIDVIAYEGVEYSGHAEDANPRYVQAVRLAAKTIRRRKHLDGSAPASVVYGYNDQAKSPKQVVKMLRRAATRARQEASA